MARILAPDNYMLAFNAPRQPQRHTITHTRFLPTGRLTRSLEALAVPLSRNYDLLHTFNRIPITRRPWITSFESALPRTFGRGSTQVREALRERLRRSNCRAVVAISEYAQRRYEQDNAGWEGLSDVARKLHVIHPNIALQRTEPKQLSGGIHLLFVGRDWARKGGVVALRVAQEAHRRGLPVRLTMISSLDQASYAQHPDAAHYAADQELLTLPNVRHYDALANPEVLRLMEEADFTVLPTTHDTYGFSVLEGMSAGTPAIVTQVAALAEVVQDGVNGYALPVEVNGIGDYSHMNSGDWERWNAFYDNLAAQTIQRLEALLDQPSHYEALSRGALNRIRDHHEAGKIGAQIEALYDLA